jgi:PAS domain S-box-containing protein
MAARDPLISKSIKGMTPLDRALILLMNRGNLPPIINIAFAIVISISASPYLGYVYTSIWCIFVVFLVYLDSFVISRYVSINDYFKKSTIKAFIDLFVVTAFCAIGLRLMLGFDGQAQILGMAVISMVLSQKLIIENLPPLGFWLSVTPPLLSATWFQLDSAFENARQGRSEIVVTDLANLVLLALIFLAIRAAVIHRREGWRRASAEIRSSARRAREAHKIAMLAEQVAGIGHFRVANNGQTTTFSDGIFEIHGFHRSTESPEFQDLLDLYPGPEKARLADMINEAVETRKPTETEVRCRLRDGRERIILIQASPEVTSSGKVAAILGVAMDVTETRSREAALAESEARMRLLADHVTDIVLWISEGGRILYASTSVRSLGYSPEEMVGRTLADFVDPSDGPAATVFLKGVFDGGASHPGITGEFRFRSRNDSPGEVWLEGRASAVRDPGGQARSAVFNFRDVTRRRELEEDLRQAKTRAEAAAEAKSEFLANMSHEVRTPLTGVLGFSTLLSQLPGLPAQAEIYLRRVVAGGEALLTVVNDILDFSKLEAGQVDLDPVPLPLRSFLDDVAGLFSAQVSGKGLALRVEVASVAPEYVLADRSRLQQVLSNLLSNAVKFTDEGEIAIRARHDGERNALVISVSDTGVGVSPTVADRLFQRFTQADGSIGRRYGGTGLGLSISRQLTELMGGGIQLHSTPGAGSTFTFEILAPAVSGQIAAMDATGVGDQEIGDLKILVVDDLEANRELARALLLAAGLDAEVAMDGPDAISLAARQAYDLILMDLQMPGMDGFATARAIREQAGPNRRTPIIALSANVMSEHVREAQQAGMNDHIAKPIVPAQFFATLSRWSGVKTSPDETIEAVPALDAGRAR